MYAQNHPQKPPPRLGATFYPGRDDDFSMDPQVVSPAPQRVMPEVPVQIAGSLEYLELEANSINRNPNIRQPPPGTKMEPQQARIYSDGYSTGSEYRDSHGYQQSIPPATTDDYPLYDHYTAHDEPHLSPFPRLINPGPKVPPTFEEKEIIVEQSRVDVLSSNDPELQLTWAYGALNHVEISLAHLARTSPEGARPDTPELEHQIKTDAINVVSFLANQHHPRAEFMKGNWLEFGKFGFRVDKKEAFKCYSRSAERGYARSEYRMGMQFENSGEPMKAIKHYTQGAAMNDSASNYRLGMMTLLGQHGQRQDYARGVHLVRLAAQTADENAPQGAYVYGMLLARELPGITVPEVFLPQDIRLAKEMIEKAAYLGFARAQLKMGTAYELCQLGCEFNPALSLHYNALAAKQGEPEAEMAISKWFLCGHEGVFEKNEELAFVYAQRAASSGLATAEFALGYFYEIGMYVPVDIQQAKVWYGKAAAHGNKDASNRIDGISRSKTLSKKDHENIALSKIRARHASQSSKINPVTERQRQASGQLLPVVEAVDMPDPQVPQIPPIPAQHQFPPRGSSTAPSINTGFINPEILAGAGQNQGGYLPRPGSAAPYPTGPNGNLPFPARSNSASGYGPGPGPGPQGRPFSPPAAGFYPQGNLGPGPQRPYPPNSGPPQSRTPHGPPPHQQQRPPPQGQGYTVYDDQQKRQSGGRPSSSGTPKPAPPVDIGFEAPVQKPKPPASPKLQQQQQPPQHRPMQSPPPTASQPPTSPGPPRPTPTPAPKPAPAPTKAGKGPKTFEEMGVAEQKKDEECVIM